MKKDEHENIFLINSICVVNRLRDCHSLCRPSFCLLRCRIEKGVDSRNRLKNTWTLTSQNHIVVILKIQ